ncbi:helix-turn-helix domain-containing protein [Paenibacillus sp. TAB 01]|uniref:helix-turn-helix domain-containing protein n=1 Tax=Paenibacillus sp. TAB 01 TaxID=3368988 RepID=UPI003752FD26
MSGHRMNLMTLQEAMDLLEVSRSTLDRWRKSKRLPFIKIGKEIYFHKEDLQHWIRRQTTVLAADEAERRPLSSSPETITIGYQSGTAYMWSPLIIKELRLFEEELALLEPSRVFSVQWRNAVSGLELVEDMIAGRVHVAYLGDYPIVVSQQLSRLLPNFNPVLLAFDGKSQRGQGISIVVPRGSNIHEPEELAGLSISTVMNSSAGCRVNRLLAALGGQPSQVIHQDMSSILTSIRGMSKGASAMWEPYISLAKFQGVGEVIFDEGLGDDYLTGIVAQEQWSQRNESCVIAYLKAHLRAHQIVRDTPMKAVSIISQAAGFPQSIVAEIIARVRWDAAVYTRDLETLLHLNDSAAAGGGNAAGSSLHPIAFRGNYLHTASRQLRLPYLTGDPLTGEWAPEQIY